MNNAPGFVFPIRIVATEDKPFHVVQNSSVDGNLLITACADKMLRLYDFRDGSLIRVFSGHVAQVNSVFITPDDSRVVSSAGRYDASWSSRATLNEDNDDNTIRIWELVSGIQLLRLPLSNTKVCHYLGVSVVTGNEAGTMIISGGYDNAVCVWDSMTGKLLTKFGGINQVTTANGTSYVQSASYHAGPITALGTFSIPNEVKRQLLHRAVSCSDDASCRVWDIGIDSVSVFTELKCLGPRSARCSQPDPNAHTQPVICLTILNKPSSKQVLITGKESLKHFKIVRSSIVFQVRRMATFTFGA